MACCPNGSFLYISISFLQSDKLLTSFFKVSIISIANSIQAYISLKGTQEVYAGPKSSATLKDIPARTIPSQSTSPVTPLSARTFGTWTALSSVVRLYAAFHIHDKNVYEICMWTYAIAWGHFVGEWLVFGTAKLGRGLAGPLIVATGTSVWMLAQWGEYVK